jgi:hypothetical protein
MSSPRIGLDGCDWTSSRSIDICFLSPPEPSPSTCSSHNFNTVLESQSHTHTYTHTHIDRYIHIHTRLNSATLHIIFITTTHFHIIQVAFGMISYHQNKEHFFKSTTATIGSQKTTSIPHTISHRHHHHHTLLCPHSTTLFPELPQPKLCPTTLTTTCNCHHHRVVPVSTFNATTNYTTIAIARPKTLVPSLPCPRNNLSGLWRDRWKSFAFESMSSDATPSSKKSRICSDFRS